MKVKLLKKVRSNIKLTNGLNQLATPNCKGVSITVFEPNGKVNTLRTSKNKIAYVNYGNAIIRRRIETLKLAKLLMNKSKLWHFFN